MEFPIGKKLPPIWLVGFISLYLYRFMRNIAKKISLWNRTRKYKYFEKKIGFTSETTVLDVGFSNNEEDYPALNYLEQHYPYPQNITALGINGKDVFCRNFPLVHAVLYDGTKFPFNDKMFDIGW